MKYKSLSRGRKYRTIIDRCFFENGMSAVDLLTLALRPSYPTTYENALAWFIAFAPRDALQDVDRLLNNVAKTLNKRNLSEIRDCWKNEFQGFESLYKRCEFLLLVQYVYKDLQHRQKSLRSEASDGLLIGDIFHEIPIVLYIQATDHQPLQACTIFTQKSKLDIVSSWDAILPQLHNVSQVGVNELNFRNIRAHLSEAHDITRIPGDVVLDHFSARDRFYKYTNDIDWCSLQFPMEPAYVKIPVEYRAPAYLISIRPLNDFVCYHVRKTCLIILQQNTNLLSVLHALVLSYIGVTTMDAQW